MVHTIVHTIVHTHHLDHLDRGIRPCKAARARFKLDISPVGAWRSAAYRVDTNGEPPTKWVMTTSVALVY